MYLPAPASHGYKLAQCISTPLDFQAEYVGSPSSPQLAMGNSQTGAERTQRDEVTWIVPTWDHLYFSQANNKWPMARETGKNGRI